MYSGNMELKVAATTLSALSHEGRLSVFRLLVEAGPGGLPAGEVAPMVERALPIVHATMIHFHAAAVRAVFAAARPPEE